MISGFNHIRRNTQTIYKKDNFFEKDQYLILNKKKIKVDLHKDIENEEIKKILSKKLITLAPGGINGFYNLGICYYIKNNYNLDNYIFSGVSAGAWNSLFLTCKKDLNELTNLILNDDIYNKKNLKEVQFEFKKKILNKYTDNDFDLDKLYLSVSVLNNYNLNNYIYTDFINLEDAINCCIASSNIPFLTGDLMLYYNNYLSFDGGFKKNKYFNCKIPLLQIDKRLWGKQNLPFIEFSKVNFYNLFIEGLNDTKNHNIELNKIFNY